MYYFFKKLILLIACGDTKSKPSFLSEKNLESSIKLVVRKFPNVDIKSLNNIHHIRDEIVKSLSLYYYTFVDLLDFKDHVGELLTTIDACQISLDITVNFEMTKLYLELVTVYIQLMILLSRVEDRKVVLGLFNAAYEMVHNQSDPAFPRLGQMVMDYDPPLKKLSEEFVPHTRTITQALLSLQNVYPRRNLSAEQWRAAQMLSLVSNPSQLLNPAHTDTMPCEYLSLDTMERWIVFGFMLCHSFLSQQHAMDLWTLALNSSWTTVLYRDEIIYTHSYVQTYFESIRGYNKRVNEVKECYNVAITTAAANHRERRIFLRTALKELVLICSDQPGLLGPKALFVFMGLCFSRDEVYWLLRHHENPPPRQGKVKINEDLVDRYLPELLFHMEELRALVRKYSQVIQRYYVQYLSGYDAVALAQMIQSTAMSSEEENVILSSICTQISALTVDNVEDPDYVFDFRSMRLDWCRLQSYLSAGRSPTLMVSQKELAALLNTISFHTQMVDDLDEMIVNTSDLSIFCFYSKIFEDNFQMCLEFPAQNRFIIAFPLICGHFSNITNDLCPEERIHIRERSLSVINLFLDEMAKEAKNIITTICDEQCNLSDRLLAKHCAPIIATVANKKRREKAPKKFEMEKPGSESYRKTREDLTTMDKLHMALTELCFAINYCSTIRY